ncbi:MAG: flagellar biosynthetic protein FliO [Actinomycetota bacterium]|nr:flagellar biosynthetic protein FliO [Actinomycetota bacterium]
MTDLVLAAQHGTAMAPDVSVGHLLVQMVLWLGVIVVALYGLSRIARRTKGAGRRAARASGVKSGRLDVVSRQPVGKGQWIAVVVAEGQRFVVGISGAGFTPLGELRGDAPRDEEPAASLGSLFPEGQGDHPRSLLDRARAATVRR